MSFIFGGNTGFTYDQIQKKRQVAEALRASNNRTPRNVGEGIAAVGRALAARKHTDEADKARAQLDDAWGKQVDGMGLDSARAAIVKALDPSARHSYALSHMDRMDAQKAAAGRRASSAADDANKQAIVAALLKGQTKQVAPFGPTIEAAEAGATSGADLGHLQTETSPVTRDGFVMGALGSGAFKPNEIAAYANLIPAAPDPMDALHQEKLQLEVDQMRNPSSSEYQIETLADDRKYYVDPSGREAPRLVNPDIEPGTKNKPMTESERRVYMFSEQQKQMAPVINQIEDEGFNPANFPDRFVGGVLGGNFLKSAEGQQYEAAANIWAEGALRLATGAAATPAEHERIKGSFFAMIGDSPETIQFKRQARQSYENVLTATLYGDRNAEIPNPFDFVEDEPGSVKKLQNPELPQLPQGAPSVLNGQSFEAFAQDPEIRSLAQEMGVSIDRLWLNIQDDSQSSPSRRRQR